MHYDHSLHSFISYNRISIILERIVKCTLMCDRLAHLRGIDVECPVCLALAFYISVMLPFVRKYYLINGAINERFLCVLLFHVLLNIPCFSILY